MITVNSINDQDHIYSLSKWVKTMKVKIKDKVKYWEALPMPREWRIVESSEEETSEKKREMARSVMEEWLSSHPMDGD